MILILALFGDLIFSFGIPNYFSILTEGLIILLFLLSLITSTNEKIYIPHFFYTFFIMVIISISSIILNRVSFLPALYSIRLLYRFYFFFISLVLLNLSDNEIRKFNNFIAFLLLMQFPVIVVKFFMYGIAEQTHGAYGGGGSLTTMLPMIVIYYFAAFYFFYKSKFWYALAACIFIMFSIVGGKRAVAFLYPVQFFSIYYYYFVKGTGASFSKKIGVFFVSSFIILLVTGSVFYFNRTLNPEGKVGGSIDPTYALDYASKYTTNVNPEGYSTGRFSSTVRTFEVLWNSRLDKFLFGYGPGAITPSVLQSKEDKIKFQKVSNLFRIKYGWTSMTRIAAEYGILGVFAFSLLISFFFKICIIYYKNESVPYWRAFAAGSAGFSMLMLFFFPTYAQSAFLGDTLPVLYFYAMAVVCIKNKAFIKTKYVKLASVDPR